MSSNNNNHAQQQQWNKEQAEYERNLLEIHKRYRNNLGLYGHMNDHMVSRSFLLTLYLQQLYLPRQQHCKLHFLHAILAEKKECLYKRQVGSYEVPKYPELSVRVMWQFAKKNIPAFEQYMPDNYDGNKNVDRSFFWGILYFLNQPLIEAVVEDVKIQRSE
jgi:hypothetical protein